MKAFFIMENNTKVDSYNYIVHFVYNGKTYAQPFHSTATITSDMESKIVREIVEDAINFALRQSRKKGIHPHSIAVEGINVFFKLPDDD